MCQLALNAFTCLNTLLNKYIEKKKDHRDILEQYSRSRIIWVESWILNKSHKRWNALAQVFVFVFPHFRGRCVLNGFFPSETWWMYWLNETTVNQEPRLPWYSVQFSSVQSLSRVRLFATPWIAARQASLSITTSRSSLRLTSNESVMPSSHLILSRPLLLLPPIPPSIRVFSNESTQVAKGLEFLL